MSAIDVPAPSEREAFEKCFSCSSPEVNARNMRRHPVDGYYVEDRIDALWDGWKARAALSVPCRQSSGWGGGGGYVQEGADVISDHAASAPSSTVSLDTTGANAPSTHEGSQ